MDPTLTCPNCRTKIKLTDSLAAPLIAEAQRRFDGAMADKDAEIRGREAAVMKGLAEIDQARSGLEDQVANRLHHERSRIAKEETERASRAAALDLQKRDRELAAANALLAEREAKLAEAQKAQAEVLRQQRALEDAQRELELTIERRVQGGLEAIREAATRDAEDQLSLKVREKDELIAGMQRQIEDLKRRSEQGSQQLQGEVQELLLEEALRRRFPLDRIEPVPKGEFGGDLLHEVTGAAGQACGLILWEAKRTRNWNDGWLAKLRDDQRAAHADVALIVSRALPKGMQGFDMVDGVWVAEPRCAMAVAIALRQILIQVADARVAGEGQQTKMELVYTYLTSAAFRRRIEAIVERVSDMQSDLDRERTAMTRLWAKREQQIQGVVASTVGLYGDLQGIAGRSLAEIDGLDLLLLQAPVTPDAG